MYKYLFYCLSILPLFALANEKRGDEFFKEFNFTQAAVMYELHLKEFPNDTPIVEKLATTYRLLNNWQKATPFYERLANFSNAKPINVFYYALCLRVDQQYRQSNVYINKYAKISGDVYASMMNITPEDLASMLDPNKSKVEILGINSELLDFAPSVHHGKLYFSSNRMFKTYLSNPTDKWQESDYLQMYEVDTNDVMTSKKEKFFSIDKLNSIYHEGPLAFHPNGDMYLTRTNYLKRRATKGSENTANLKLFLLKKNDTNWSTNLKDACDFSNKNYSIGHATFNADGSIMYFSSDMPGGFGGTDIWYATYNGKTYTNPINMGPKINTKGAEMFPHFANGKLYFASNAWKGLGGLDIFISDLKGGFPENIGSNINSKWDDFGAYFTSEYKGYFTSNRPGRGSDDIYKFALKPNIKTKIYIYDLANNQPIQNAKFSIKGKKDSYLTERRGGITLDFELKKTDEISAIYKDYKAAKIEYNVKDINVKIGMIKRINNNLEILVLDKKTKEPINAAEVIIDGEKFLTDNSGFIYRTVKSDQYFTYKANKYEHDKPLYFPDEDKFNTVGLKPTEKKRVTILLQKLEVGVSILIKNIYYDLDKYNLRQDAYVELNKLLTILNDYQTMKIRMTSHTDCRSTKEYNLKLSENRAKSVMTYLIEKGISIDRLEYKGYGESKLVNNCACECQIPVKKIGLREFRKIEDKQVINCSDEDHFENRRTEFEILQLE